MYTFGGICMILIFRGVFSTPKVAKIKTYHLFGSTLVSRQQEKIFFDYPVIDYSLEDLPANFMDYVELIRLGIT